MITASEVGDRVINSEKTKEVLDPSIDLLKTWIKKEKDDLLKSQQKKD